MTLPKNKSRKIIVNSETYRYQVTGNDGWIDLVIELENAKGKKYFAAFEYFHNKLTIELLIGLGYKLGDDLIITPKIVRRVIQFALKNGWKPLDKENPENRLFLWDSYKWEKYKLPD